MVAQLGQPENYSVCPEMHEVWVVKVVCDAKATPRVVYYPHREYYFWFQGSSFMRFLVVVQDEGWAVLCSLTDKTSWNKKSQELEYIYPFFPPSTPFCFPPVWNHTTSILNSLYITWLIQNNASCSKTHSIFYKTLYVATGLPSTPLNCSIMVMRPV